MALIRLGSMATDARGSIGGVTFSRNRGGAYARKRVKPTNPDSTLQSIARSAIAAASRAWGDLTQGERDQWDTYALSHPVQNRIGDTQYLSGEQWFVSVYRNYATAGVAFVSTPPPFDPTFLPAPLFKSVSFSADKLQIMGAQNIAIGTIIQIWASGPVSPGRTKSIPVKLIETVTLADAIEENELYDITTPWVARYGALPVNQVARIGIEVRQFVSGILSPKQTFSNDITFPAP